MMEQCNKKVKVEVSNYYFTSVATINLAACSSDHNNLNKLALADQTTT